MCLGRKGPVLPDDYRSHGQDHEDPGKRGTGSRGGFHSLEQAPDAVGQGVSLKLMAFFRFHAAWLLSWNCTQQRAALPMGVPVWLSLTGFDLRDEDRKSTRLNSSHANISYAVFCLKKKKTIIT